MTDLHGGRPGSTANEHSVRRTDLTVAASLMRDTKLGEASPVLRVHRAAEWQAFIAGVKVGEFD